MNVLFSEKEKIGVTQIVMRYQNKNNLLQASPPNSFILALSRQQGHSYDDIPTGTMGVKIHIYANCGANFKDFAQFSPNMHGELSPLSPRQLRLLVDNTNSSTTFVSQHRQDIIIRNHTTSRFRLIGASTLINFRFFRQPLALFWTTTY